MKTSKNVTPEKQKSLVKERLVDEERERTQIDKTVFMLKLQGQMKSRFIKKDDIEGGSPSVVSCDSPHFI